MIDCKKVCLDKILSKALLITQGFLCVSFLLSTTDITIQLTRLKLKTLLTKAFHPTS